jgi:hypothetical protein
MAAVHDGVLPLTTLGRFELLNAIRLSVFRQQLKPQIVAIDVLTIKADIESGGRRTENRPKRHRPSGLA